MATTSPGEDEQHTPNDHSSAEVSNNVQKEAIQVNGLPVTDVSSAEGPDEKCRTPVSLQITAPEDLPSASPPSGPSPPVVYKVLYSNKYDDVVFTKEDSKPIAVQSNLDTRGDVSHRNHYGCQSHGTILGQ